jgi:hypothetical protein
MRFGFGRRWRRWCGARSGPGARWWSPTRGSIRWPTSSRVWRPSSVYGELTVKLCGVGLQSLEELIVHDEFDPAGAHRRDVSSGMRLVQAAQDGVDRIDARLIGAQRGELPVQLLRGGQARGTGPAPSCVGPNWFGLSFAEPAERSGFQLLSRRVHYLGAHTGPTDNPQRGRRGRP